MIHGRQTWQYQMVGLAEVTGDTLDALGADGWELITAIDRSRLIFKRPGPDFRDQVTLDQRSVATARDKDVATE